MKNRFYNLFSASVVTSVLTLTTTALVYLKFDLATIGEAQVYFIFPLLISSLSSTIFNDIVSKFILQSEKKHQPSFYFNIFIYFSFIFFLALVFLSTVLYFSGLHRLQGIDSTDPYFLLFFLSVFIAFFYWANSLMRSILNAFDLYSSVRRFTVSIAIFCFFINIFLIYKEYNPIFVFASKYFLFGIGIYCYALLVLFRKNIMQFNTSFLKLVDARDFVASFISRNECKKVFLSSIVNTTEKRIDVLFTSFLLSNEDVAIFKLLKSLVNYLFLPLKSLQVSIYHSFCQHQDLTVSNALMLAFRIKYVLFSVAILFFVLVSINLLFDYGAALVFPLEAFASAQFVFLILILYKTIQLVFYWLRPYLFSISKHLIWILASLCFSIVFIITAPMVVPLWSLPGLAVSSIAALICKFFVGVICLKLATRNR